MREIDRVEPRWENHRKRLSWRDLRLAEDIDHGTHPHPLIQLEWVETFSGVTAS